MTPQQLEAHRTAIVLEYARLRAIKPDQYSSNKTCMDEAIFNIEESLSLLDEYIQEGKHQSVLLQEVSTYIYYPELSDASFIKKVFKENRQYNFTYEEVEKALKNVRNRKDYEEMEKALRKV